MVNAYFNVRTSKVESLARSGKSLYAAILLTLSAVLMLSQLVMSIVDISNFTRFYDDAYVAASVIKLIYYFLILPLPILLVVGAWLTYARAKALSILQVVQKIKQVFAIIFIILLAVLAFVLFTFSLEEEINPSNAIIIQFVMSVVIAASVFNVMYYSTCCKVLSDASYALRSGREPQNNAVKLRALSLMFGIISAVLLTVKVALYADPMIYFGSAYSINNSISIFLWNVCSVSIPGIVSSLLAMLLYFAAYSLAGGYKRIYYDNAIKEKTVN